MKIVHQGYNFAIPLNENQIAVLSIENVHAYTEILQDIWNQIQGGDGKFILSDKGKILKISKEVDCIFNPFSLKCNDRKIITRLYQQIKEQADNFFLEETMKMNTNINQFLDALLLQVPYALKHNQELDMVNLLKLYDVGFECSAETVLEQIIEYLRIMNKLCGITVYVFVGLKQYLSSCELKELYKFAFYEKINILIIESIHTPLIEGEKGWIIDSDLCIIEL